ncbi:hypothetical protein [Caballeronia sp. DA-9]|uniref:hypothetical protein n=1 Tax=Caballeronia sp. DA-9 TaxID=3436237 RepID=UPI003F66237C
MHASTSHAPQPHSARWRIAWIKIAMSLFMMLPGAWIGVSFAQGASGSSPAMSASASADSDASSGNQDAASPNGGGDTAAIQGDLQLLRAMAWGSTVVAVLIALAAYVYMHKNLWPNDSLYGLIITLVLAPLFLLLCTMLILSPAAKDCVDATLQATSDIPYDAVCGKAREGVADFAGMKSLWALASPPAVNAAGLPIPYPPTFVKILMYVSTLITGVVLYFILKPSCRRFLAHRRR